MTCRLLSAKAIIWSNAGILSIGPMGTNFSEILIEIHTFSFKKMHLKMSSGKWRPFCVVLDVLSKQSRRCWFEAPSLSLWRHCNETLNLQIMTSARRIEAGVSIAVRTHSAVTDVTARRDTDWRLTEDLVHVRVHTGEMPFPWCRSSVPWFRHTGLIIRTYLDDVIKWKHFPRDWPFVRGIGEFIGHQLIPRTKASGAEL